MPFWRTPSTSTPGSTPPPGAGKIRTRPYADGYFHNYFPRRQDLLHRAISAMPTPPANRPPCCTLTPPTAPRKRCSRPSCLTPTASTCANPFAARRLRACRSGISPRAERQGRLRGLPAGHGPATSSRPPRSRRRACAAPLLLACTASGQWLTTANPRDSYDPQYSLYALWGPGRLFGRRQPTAWVTMYATE